MGLLDKLFGKKEKPIVSEPVASPSSSSKPSFDYSPSPVNNIETVISSNPLSSKYRVPFRDEVNVPGLSFFEFKSKYNGSFVALDLETTGLSPVNDFIVEICAVKVISDQIVDEYHQYINPGISMPSSASAVNHITDSMLLDKPKIYEILPNVLDFIGDNIVVCHNVRFDLSFLCQACLLYRFKTPSSCFDTMDLSELWPDLKDKKLSSFLSAAFIQNLNPHSASGDAEALAKLMIVSLQKQVHLKSPDGFDPGYSNTHFAGTVDLIDDKLSKKRFVVTGEIPGYEREEFEKLICSHGGKTTIKISNATDYLITGLFTNYPEGYISAKTAYANKLIESGGKIKIISYNEFFQMLE